MLFFSSGRDGEESGPEKIGCTPSLAGHCKQEPWFVLYKKGFQKVDKKAVFFYYGAKRLAKRLDKMHRSQRSPTIKDVAMRAGVSVATVSAVINRNRFVSSTLVERVLKAIQELNYHPNRIARGLKQRRSFSIVYMIPDIANPIFASVTRGIQDVMERYCYDVSLYNTDFSNRKLFHQLTSVLENRPDGIILSAWRGPEIQRAVSLLRELGIPLVIVHAPRDVEGVDTILVDDVMGAFEAVTYLLQLGHRDILSLGVVESTTSKLRERGYCLALERAGLPLRKELLVCGTSFAPESAQTAIHRVLEVGISFSAVFAHSDSLAIGALEALVERGFRIPEDVSIVGFDGTHARCTFPRLTTMVIPNYEMGKMAAEILYQRIIASGPFEVVQREVRPYLLVQGSTRQHERT